MWIYIKKKIQNKEKNLGLSLGTKLPVMVQFGWRNQGWDHRSPSRLHPAQSSHCSGLAATETILQSDWSTS